MKTLAILALVGGVSFAVALLPVTAVAMWDAYRDWRRER